MDCSSISELLVQIRELNALQSSQLEQILTHLTCLEHRISREVDRSNGSVRETKVHAVRRAVKSLSMRELVVPVRTVVGHVSRHALEEAARELTAPESQGRWGRALRLLVRRYQE